MDGVSLVVGIIPIVIQLYAAVSKGYDTFIEYKEFPSSYRELQLALKIEKQRLELWGQKMLGDHRQHQIEPSQQDLSLWILFEDIFKRMASDLEGGMRTIEDYGHLVGQSKKSDLFASNSQDPLSATVEVALKDTVNNMARKVKFVLIDKKKVERLAKRLCFYNDSLDKMTSSRLEQESSRRRLRTYLSNQDPELLRQAAAVLEHRDIETMASFKSIIKGGYRIEHGGAPEKADESQGLHEYRLEYNQLNFHGNPFSADQSRTIATFQGETVLIDWRCCRDGTWRRENPAAFQQRTENLAKILNSDLRPLNLSVLHCVGYLNQNRTVTGYAFRLPPEAHSKQVPQKPLTLHHLLANTTKPSDVPDLGERFELAKTLVSTIFEFHNMGWMHKNIQSKNILFWTKPDSPNEANLRQPYLVGFDTSRPNESGEISEKPFSTSEDDFYRHPKYRIGPQSNSFQPPFDMYSLGIVLFEIGLWVVISLQKGTHARRSSRPAHPASSSSFPSTFSPPLPPPPPPPPSSSSSPFPPSSSPSSSSSSQNQSGSGSRASFEDSAFMDNLMKGPIMDLKQYMGIRYRDAVVACLNGTFDRIWEQRSKGEGGGEGEGEEEMEKEKEKEKKKEEQMQRYLDEVQNRLVDVIARCSA